jgi:uncharacterized membrane protein
MTDVAISRLLRGGVVLSISVVILGAVLSFVHHPSYVRSKPALSELTDAQRAYPHTIGDVLRGVARGRGQAVIMLGLLLLIATPLARVALSIGIFAVARDRLYVAITTAVLLLLLVSFAAGASG